MLELTPEGARRRYLLVVPAAHVATLHARRLAEIGLRDDAAEESPPQAWPATVRARVTASALADACRLAGEQALAALRQRIALAIASTPQVETLAGPPDGDLILRAELWTLPAILPPDPAGLRIERLVALPDPAEEARALAAMAAMRAALADQPPGTVAQPGDELVCDIAASLLPAENRIPQPGLADAAPGTPGRLPDGWSFGDNGAGLAIEVLAVATAAQPPHLRLRIHGTAPADGQSFVIFHPAGAIGIAPGANWVGSVALRAVGTPRGLRGSKLRLESQPATADRTLRRKDAAVALRPGEPGFARCYVSDRMHDAGSALLRMPLLFDHAAGPVDFTLDIAAPRLVEGLDLGDQGNVPLPEFTARNQRITLGAPAPDPAGLLPHLAGIAAGEQREIVLRLPDGLEDRAIAGRKARFVVTVRSLLRRVTPPVDDTLAQAMGFADLPALRHFVARRVADRHAALSDRLAREALIQALLDAAAPIPLPEPALQAELAAQWSVAAEAARQRGAEPPAQSALAPAASRRLRLRLLLDAVARRHGLVPDEAALKAEAAKPGAPPLAELRLRATEDLALAFLIARAQVTERPVPASALAAAAQ